jgi:hypothetical protein
MCDILKQLKEAQHFADKALEDLSDFKPFSEEQFGYYLGVAHGIKLLNGAIYEEVFPYYHPLGPGVKSYEDYREWHHKQSLTAPDKQLQCWHQ